MRLKPAWIKACSPLASVRRAWRGWSAVNASVHYACYESETMALALAVPGSEALGQLVAEFDRMWGDTVTRTRDVVEILQALEGG